MIPPHKTCSQRTTNANQARGFTLVELLVGVAIGTALMAAIASLFVVTSRLVYKNQQIDAAVTNTRLVQERLYSELSEAISQTNPVVIRPEFAENSSTTPVRSASVKYRVPVGSYAKVAADAPSTATSLTLDCSADVTVAPKLGDYLLMDEPDLGTGIRIVHIAPVSPSAGTITVTLATPLFASYSDQDKTENRDAVTGKLVRIQRERKFTTVAPSPVTVNGVTSLSPVTELHWYDSTYNTEPTLILSKNVDAAARYMFAQVPEDPLAEEPSVSWQFNYKTAETRTSVMIGGANAAFYETNSVEGLIMPKSGDPLNTASIHKTPPTTTTTTASTTTTTTAPTTTTNAPTTTTNKAPTTTTKTAPITTTTLRPTTTTTTKAPTTTTKATTTTTQAPTTTTKAPTTTTKAPTTTTKAPTTTTKAPTTTTQAPTTTTKAPTTTTKAPTTTTKAPTTTTKAPTTTTKAPTTTTKAPTTTTKAPTTTTTAPTTTTKAPTTTTNKAPTTTTTTAPITTTTQRPTTTTTTKAPTTTTQAPTTTTKAPTTTTKAPTTTTKAPTTTTKAPTTTTKAPTTTTQAPTTTTKAPTTTTKAPTTTTKAPTTTTKAPTTTTKAPTTTTQAPTTTTKAPTTTTKPVTTTTTTVTTTTKTIDFDG